MTINRAFIGIGSNVENPRRQVQQAVVEISQLKGCQLIAASKSYETKPVGYLAQPNFINAAVAIDTSLPVDELLLQLQKIEQTHGRVRSKNRCGPRTLDLDLLVFGREVINEDYLQIPHPRMLERDFVLLPLAEVSADFDDLLQFVRKAVRP